MFVPLKLEYNKWMRSAKTKARIFWSTAYIWKCTVTKKNKDRNYEDDPSLTH